MAEQINVSDLALLRIKQSQQIAMQLVKWKWVGWLAGWLLAGLDGWLDSLDHRLVRCSTNIIHAMTTG